MTEKPGKSAMIPNSFQTPNALVDRLMPLLTGEEYKVLSFAIRHIYGWRDKLYDRKAKISLSQFGRTGISKSAVMNALDKLVEFGLLIKDGAPDNEGQCWRLGFDEADPDWRAMEERAAERKEQGRARTKAGRSVAQTGGLSDRPEVVCRTDTTKDNIQTQSLQAKPVKAKSKWPTTSIVELDPLFSAVAVHCFKLKPDHAYGNGRTRARIYGCVAVLIQQEKALAGGPDEALTPERRAELAKEAPGLVAWYENVQPGTTFPTGNGTFATWVLRWFEAGKPNPSPGATARPDKQHAKSDCPTCMGEGVIMRQDELGNLLYSLCACVTGGENVAA